MTASIYLPLKPNSVVGQAYSELFLPFSDVPAVAKSLSENPEGTFEVDGNRPDFWVRVLGGIIRERQLYLITGNPDKPSDLVARTLMQIDGDVILKINDRFLFHEEGLAALDTHLAWTHWFLHRLGETLTLPNLVRSLSEKLFQGCGAAFILGAAASLASPILNYLALLPGWGYYSLQAVGIAATGAGFFRFNWSSKPFYQALAPVAGAIAAALDVLKTGNWFNLLWLLLGAAAGPLLRLSIGFIVRLIIRRQLARFF